MPFGATNASATYQHHMDKVLEDLEWISFLVYLNNVMVFL
jgi:hypothetical protein